MKQTRDLIYRNRVYEYRTELGISQEKMAKDLDISRRSISKIECGEQNASLEMVYRICAYLDRMVPDVFPLNDTTHLPTYEECMNK